MVTEWGGREIAPSRHDKLCLLRNDTIRGAYIVIGVGAIAAEHCRRVCSVQWGSTYPDRAL